MRRLAIPLLSCLFLLPPGWGEAATNGDTVTSRQEDFRIVVIAEDLHHPWSLAFLPGNEYLVSERRGKLWRIAKDGAKTEIRGLPPVYHEGQGGLLDVAPEAGFRNGGWLYFSYAAARAGDEDIANTEVARARLDLGGNRLTDMNVIFRAEPKVEGGNHWGSRLLFAPDGTLFVTLGERFDYEEEAQNPENHLGAIVRLLPDGGIPPGNPFVNGGGAPAVYTYGHRNVQGIALRPGTGEVWIHEHGPRGGDEINILKAGANYGWPAVTFGVSYMGLEISDKASAPGMEDPLLQWTPSIAPSGMAFYDGAAFPAWRGDLFLGALAGQHLRRLEIEGGKITGEEILLQERNARVRDVRAGADGFLYILTDAPDGRLLRLEPP